MAEGPRADELNHVSQADIIAVLQHEGKLPAKDIPVRIAGMTYGYRDPSPRTLRQCIERLLEKGFVAREPGERGYLYYATERGIKAWRKWIVP